MPFGILFIMKKSEVSFRTAKDLATRIDKYFTYIEGEYHLDEKDKPVWDREPDPATIAGLALFLGFNSIQGFITYEGSGRFANVLKKGRLRVEWIYEKKLHQQSSAGAIFMLKSMGWDNND